MRCGLRGGPLPPRAPRRRLCDPLGGRLLRVSSLLRSPFHPAATPSYAFWTLGGFNNPSAVAIRMLFSVCGTGEKLTRTGPQPPVQAQEMTESIRNRHSSKQCHSPSKATERNWIGSGTTRALEAARHSPHPVGRVSCARISNYILSLLISLPKIGLSFGLFLHGKQVVAGHGELPQKP